MRGKTPSVKSQPKQHGNEHVKDPGIRRSVLITQASTPLGRALALGYAKRGSALILVCENETGLATIAREIELMGAPVILCHLHPDNPDALKHAAWQGAARFEGIDLWINLSSDAFPTEACAETALPYLMHSESGGQFIDVSHPDSFTQLQRLADLMNSYDRAGVRLRVMLPRPREILRETLSPLPRVRARVRELLASGLGVVTLAAGIALLLRMDWSHAPLWEADSEEDLERELA